MNNRKNILWKSVLLSMVAALGACSEFLDPYPQAIRSEEEIFANQSAVQGLINRCYISYMPSNYNNNDGAYLDGATDNAALTATTSAMNRLATGTMSSSDNPFETYWKQDYSGIYNANLFLKDDRGYNTRYMTVEYDVQNELLRRRLKGEAFALRAWFEWDLLKKFGGRGVNGQLLGFPIMLEPIDIGGMSADEIARLDFRRNTYDECVRQIEADCDSALKYLPRAYRDFLLNNSYLPQAYDGIPVSVTTAKIILGGQQYGRLDGITMLALKAQMYLTWASPRFNPQNSMTRWAKAAHFAKEVMDFKQADVNSDGSGFAKETQVNWFNPNDPCIVFASRYGNNDAMEKMFLPGGFDGCAGEIGASQNLVDAFGMKDGYPIGESPAYPYNPQNPMANRDARLYSVIFYNNQTITPNTMSIPYTFECYADGKDAPNKSTANSRTGYYVKKFVSPRYDSRKNTGGVTAPHSRFHIRWAHIVLAFAEAANQIGGPVTPYEGLTAKEAIGYLRSRTTYDGEFGISHDPYLEQMALSGKEAFDLFLRNERRIETCFEGLWFFDLRRWSTTLGELNQDVRGVSITKQQNGSFLYDYNYVVGQRIFRSAYLPIPYKEIANMSGMTQNEGWESWQ